eukprot:1145536-Pelagomonas_calceolata.AAC.3
MKGPPGNMWMHGTLRKSRRTHCLRLHAWPLRIKRERMHKAQMYKLAKWEEALQATLVVGEQCVLNRAGQFHVQILPENSSNSKWEPVDPVLNPISCSVVCFRTTPRFRMEFRQSQGPSSPILPQLLFAW